MARPSFSSWEYFFSATDRNLEANAIGFSEPSGNLCDSTAPMPKGEALQEMTTTLCCGSK